MLMLKKKKHSIRENTEEIKGLMHTALGDINDGVK